MRIGFVCPDGEKIKFGDCLSKCRMAERCLTVPTLLALSKVREWKGVPSVTQCLKGTREAFLDITVDHYVSPQKFAFALLGTDHHKNLERHAATAEVFGEESFKDPGMTGQVDLLDGDILTDYKTWGAFKCAKALGIYKVDVPTGEVYKSGEKKGQAKTRKEVRQSPDRVDMKDAVYQLNRYRLFFEKAGFPIRKMQIQATVRDGGLMATIKYGLTQNIYLIPVPKLPDEEVEKYFSEKGMALVEALKTGVMPPVCTAEERWDDRKCENYCSINFACSHWQEVLAKSEKEE